ncbi:hypothetical protein [Listeria valentina]|uniref:hypothetical protein n=1 Tax=Listeria valentina TaxID=2705293 RepID=UPI00142F92C4|nr:hypothetical protein [Listeria valentina]
MNYMTKLSHQIPKHKLIVNILSVSLAMIPAGTALAVDTPTNSKPASQTESKLRKKTPRLILPSILHAAGMHCNIPVA